jgi:hypothetical protein
MSTRESLLLAPDFVRDPHAGLERLREEEPAYQTPISAGGSSPAMKT